MLNSQAEGAGSRSITGMEFKLLGPLDIGGGIRLPTRKAEALLAFLALPAGRPHRRDALMGLLWGDRAERQARHSLSQTLFSLRKAVTAPENGPSPIVVDGDTVMLSPGSAVVDVERFEALAAAGEAERLAEAAALYRGELLQGFGLRELAFEEWLATERSRVKEMAHHLFRRLLGHYETAGELDRAIQAAVRLIGIDPLQEAAHRALMGLYMRQGRHAAALRQYEVCAEILQRDLGVDPEAETRALRAEIVRRRSARSPTSAASPAAEPKAPPVVVASASSLPRPDVLPPIGRSTEMQSLLNLFASMQQGDRAVVFIVGEGGIGKSTLVDAFVAAAHDACPGILAGRGQCIDHRGGAEPYHPVLDALSTLCREPGEFVACLEAYAPTWVPQLPVPPAVRAQNLPVGTTQERMLREMVSALEAAALAHPLLLVLEDLHWSDCSTLDLVEALARRRGPARLMLVATYRRADAAIQASPVQTLARDLRVRGLSEEVALAALDEPATARYLAERFPAAPEPDGVARVLCRRSGGNPLFMAHLVDWWIGQGVLRAEGGSLTVQQDIAALEVGVPEDLDFLIERQLERLDAHERSLLAAASVTGAEVLVASVAAALEIDEEGVEDGLSRLARQGLFLREEGARDWPDGTSNRAFSFRHDLYRDGLYQRLTIGSRRRLHCRIGARLERAFSGARESPAAELAMHFLNGRDAQRAVKYLELAAQQAMRRSAYRDAAGFVAHALKLVPLLPPQEQATSELRLQAIMAPALVFTRGWSDPEAEGAYRRALELGEAVGDNRRLSSVMFGLASLLEFRAEFAKTQALLAKRLALLDRERDPSATVESEELMACSKFHHGRFPASVEHAERALAAYDDARDLALNACIGDNPAVACHNWIARSLWFLGRGEEALERAHEGLAVAQRDGYSFALALAHEQLARQHQHRGEVEAALHHAVRAATLGEEYGFAYRVVAGRVLRGWARAMLGDNDAGLADIGGGLEVCSAIGALLEYPYLLALKAEALNAAGRPEMAVEVADEAHRLSRKSDGFFYDAEILRLIGWLRLCLDRFDGRGLAEKAFHEALRVSRKQEAKNLEWRIVANLGALWERQGRREEARQLLGGLHTSGMPASPASPLNGNTI